MLLDFEGGPQLKNHSPEVMKAARGIPNLPFRRLKTQPYENLILERPPKKEPPPRSIILRPKEPLNAICIYIYTHAYIDRYLNKSTLNHHKIR